ncbi:hypothetical protein [Spirosoma rhododendri]|uniref:Uncharacterized protein n=1 Tax=Spirosoma rhododendri TaxID=2728024 RepID=A0A7L5DUA8_9BACT|nr:hypothetical protein [Spirosoma rhododendri]QJD81665.1 hypothetical protein HH216_25325 [Spirosoma rhododendri]
MSDNYSLMSLQHSRSFKKPISNAPLIVAVLLVFFFIGLPLYFVDRAGEVSTTTPNADTTTYTPRYGYAILSETMPGNFSNYAVFVPKDADEQTVLATAQLFKKERCTTNTCNVVTFWNDKDQYSLYVKKQDDAQWRKKHWAKMCEANVADYVVGVNEFTFYPMLDNEYRKYGGTKKRPTQTMHNL